MVIVKLFNACFRFVIFLLTIEKMTEYIVMLAIVLLNFVTVSDMLHTEIRNLEMFDNLTQSWQ